MSFAVPRNRTESGRPNLDPLRSPKAEACKNGFPLWRERRRHVNEHSMYAFALKLNGPQVFCSLNSAVGAHQNILLPGPYTQAPQLVCETIRCNSKEPGWAWPEKTLCSQEILQLRIGLL